MLKLKLKNVQKNSTKVKGKKHLNLNKKKFKKMEKYNSLADLDGGLINTPNPNPPTS